jgi:hypothetical protein
MDNKQHVRRGLVVEGDCNGRTVYQLVQEQAFAHPWNDEPIRPFLSPQIFPPSLNVHNIGDRIVNLDHLVMLTTYVFDNNRVMDDGPDDEQVDMVGSILVQDDVAYGEMGVDVDGDGDTHGDCNMVLALRENHSAHDNNSVRVGTQEEVGHWIPNDFVVSDDEVLTTISSLRWWTWRVTRVVVRLRFMVPT